jgi:hypothetical protein
MTTDRRYNRRRIGQGVGLLIALWAAAMMLMLSTGVALSVPPAEGGYKLEADSVQGETFRLYAGYTDSTQSDRLTAAVNEIGSISSSGLRIVKRLSLEDMPGVNGYLRVGIATGSANAESGTLTLKARTITADQLRLRGAVIDEDFGADISNRFVIYAGNNPEAIAEKDLNIETPGSQNAFEATNLRTRAYYINADRLQLSNLRLVMEYDPDGDGTYEYGV